MGYKASLGRINDVHKVQCEICMKVEEKEKLLMLKLDNLLKHAGRCKTKVSKLGITTGPFYFSFKS
jgi:hypothetical protein